LYIYSSKFLLKVLNPSSYASTKQVDHGYADMNIDSCFIVVDKVVLEENEWKQSRRTKCSRNNENKTTK